MTEKTKKRNAKTTRKRILTAAKKEFARLGYGGARVDNIAKRASVNKRMIYHYFGDKRNLFKTVIEIAYIDIRTAEHQLQLEQLDPREALVSLVKFTWQYYLKNPEFIRLVNSENLYKAVHLKASDQVQAVNRQFVTMVDSLLVRGVNAGVFHKGIDPVQLNITIAALGYYYLTNCYTGSIIFERNLMESGALQARLQSNIQTILRFVCLPEALTENSYLC